MKDEKGTYRFVMCCCLNQPYRLHEGVLDCDTDITARVSLAQLTQLPIVCLIKLAWCGSNRKFEHLHTCGQVGQTDVYSPLETTTNGSIELPGDIRRAKNEDTSGVLAYTVHLHEKFGFDAARCFGLAFPAWAAESIDLVDEDDGWLVFTGHVEQLLHQTTIC